MIYIYIIFPWATEARLMTPGNAPLAACSRQTWRDSKASVSLRAS